MKKIIEEPKIIVAEKWNVPIERNPVRNTGQDYLKFINTSYFSEEAYKFLKYGYYTDAPYGTKDFEDYWDEQERRCLEGYIVGGVRITGRHYFFLNFGRMLAVPIDPNTGKPSKTRKIITFPRFLDHQYYLFHEFEKNFAEGNYEGMVKIGMVILKSRRLGITYVNSNGIIAYDYNFYPDSKSVIGVYEKAHYTVTLDAVHGVLNHVNKHTDWAKRRSVLNKYEQFRASFKRKDITGIEVEEGFMSQVEAISFKDNPFRSIGYSVDKFCWEEAGKFKGLLASYTFTHPTLKDGDLTTGVSIVWGTGGDVEAGSADLAEMFTNPSAYDLKAYDNIYEDNSVGECGYFIDTLWYRMGTVKVPIFNPSTNKEEPTEVDMVDNAGNSLRDYANVSIENERKVRIKGSRDAYNKYITQEPKTPSEALLRSAGNVFDAVRCQLRLGEIMANIEKYNTAIFRVDLHIRPSDGEVYYTFNDTSQPLYEFPLKDNKNKPGVIEIYEQPVRDTLGKVYTGRYIGSIDSYDKDVSTTNSVGSLFILDTWTDRIVCHYKGRPFAHVFYENCRKILKYYNAVANYERSNLNIYTHFYNASSLHLLCDEPQILAEKGMSTGNLVGNNKKGTAPGDKTNALGIELAIKYMNTRAYGEPDISEVVNYDKIKSIPLLKEMIGWNPEGNFDDVSSLGMLMILREDKAKSIARITEKVKTLADDSFWDRNYRKGSINNFYSTFSYNQNK